MTIKIHVEPRNGSPRRGVAASQNGVEIFRSLLNVDDGWARKCFVRDALKRLPKVSPVPSDADMADWDSETGGPAVTEFDEDTLADQLLREADAVDEQEAARDAGSESRNRFRIYSSVELDELEFSDAAI